MIHYTGNGAYCFTNSLHMCLQNAGAEDWITPWLIESVGGMAFGAMVMCFDKPCFFPGSPNNDPDRAVSRALSLLGWACDETRGGDAESALERLRTAAVPFQVGPCNYGALTYDPHHTFLQGCDHFVTVLAIEDGMVRLHDPLTSPFSTLPIDEFMIAWRGDGVDYGPNARSLQYVMRANFRQVESISRDEALRRGVEALREQMAAVLDGPQLSGGPHAFRALAAIARGNVPEDLRTMLVEFSLPLGARRCHDAALFLGEAGLHEAAAHAEAKARLYGAALYNAVNQRWTAFSAQAEQLAQVETALIAALNSNG